MRGLIEFVLLLMLGLVGPGQALENRSQAAGYSVRASFTEVRQLRTGGTERRKIGVEIYFGTVGSTFLRVNYDGAIELYTLKSNALSKVPFLDRVMTVQYERDGTRFILPMPNHMASHFLLVSPDRKSCSIRSAYILKDKRRPYVFETDRGGNIEVDAITTANQRCRVVPGNILD